jgi:hypothetical protein
VLPDVGDRVRFRFTNDSPEVEWLARSRAFFDVPDGDHLEFEPEAMYLGVQVKRTPYEQDELLAVEPGQSVESPVVDLADLYHLPRGGLLKVRYMTYHPLRGSEGGRGSIGPVVSDWVELPSSV